MPKDLRIRFQDPLFEKVKEMSGHYGLTVPEIIRSAVHEKYHKIYLRELYGYKGSKTPEQKLNKQERMDAARKKLADMDDGKLNEHLCEIGYNNKEKKPEDGIWILFRVYTDNGGHRKLQRQYFKEQGDETPYYTSDAFTWDEMLADMRKTGFIKV